MAHSESHCVSVLLMGEGGGKGGGGSPSPGPAGRGSGHHVAVLRPCPRGAPRRSSGIGASGHWRVWGDRDLQKGCRNSKAGWTLSAQSCPEPQPPGRPRRAEHGYSTPRPRVGSIQVFLVLGGQGLICQLPPHKDEGLCQPACHAVGNSGDPGVQLAH